MDRLVFIVALSIQILTVSGQPRVRVEQGEIQGKTVPFHDEGLEINTNVDAYLGIPYAEPPLGEGRFAPPRPKEALADGEIYDATFNRDICVQESFFNEKSSEDCLHLNVYAPNPKPSNASVMVFIHGGAYTSGDGYDGDFPGFPLAAIGEVILVTFNYRLSALGFLTTGDNALPGNYGMLDQVLAIKWVRDNIQAFGGDARKITLFGESAGGGSVSAHLFSPLSHDYFDQAIIQSGSILAGWSFYEPTSQRDKAFELGAAVGCSSSNSQELLSCMREVDALTMIRTASAIAYDSAPCVDNNFLIEEPIKSLENNNFKKCPIIDGFNKDEGTYYIITSEFGLQYLDSSVPPYVSKETFDTELPKFYKSMGLHINDLIEDSIKQQYVDWSMADDPEADYFNAWNQAVGDQYFTCPGMLETRYHAMAGEADVYQYFFTHNPSISVGTSIFGSPGWLGAGHGEDLAFVFGYPFVPATNVASHEYTDDERNLSYQMIKYWTNFAKTGNPGKETADSTPYNDERAWPTFTIPGLQYKELAVNLADGRGLKADQCHFWNEYFKQLTTFSANLPETEKEWREEFYSWKYTHLEDWRDAFGKYQEAVNKP